MFRKKLLLCFLLICLLAFSACAEKTGNNNSETADPIVSEDTSPILLEGNDWRLHEDGVLYIETTAGARNWATYNKDHSYKAKWRTEWRENIVPVIQKIVLCEGVRALPDHTALNLSALTELQLPETLEVIEESAIMQCFALQYLEIPRNVRWISGRPMETDYAEPWPFEVAVDHANQWYEVVDGMLIEKETGNLLYAFSEAEEITVPEYVKTIDRYSFYNCQKLKTLYVNSSCEIDDYAVAGNVDIVRSTDGQ